MLLIWFSKLRSGSKMTLRFFTFGLTCRVRFPSLFIISSLWVSVPMIRTSVLSLFNSSTAQYWRSSLAEVVGHPYCQVLQINTSGCHQHNSENESCSHGSFCKLPFAKKRSATYNICWDVRAWLRVVMLWLGCVCRWWTVTWNGIAQKDNCLEMPEHLCAVW